MAKLTVQQQDLVTKNINLAYFIKNQWIKRLEKNKTMDINEIESCCLMGLVKASRGFDVTKKIKFATFATKCMNNEVLMFLRQQSKHALPVSLFEKVNYKNEEHDLVYQDIITSDGLDFDEKIISEIFIKEKMESMVFTKRDKLILDMLKDGKTQHEIGFELNISQSYVSRLKRKLKKNITKHLSK